MSDLHQCINSGHPPLYHSAKLNSIQASRIQVKVEFPYRFAATSNCRLNTYYELNSAHTCRFRLWSQQPLVNKKLRSYAAPLSPHLHNEHFDNSAMDTAEDLESTFIEERN